MSSICETSTTFIRRLGNHEPRAWEDFATKYTWMMRRWFRSKEFDWVELDDILQDTCLRVFQNIHQFRSRGHGSFRAWLKEISRSCWLQAVRQSAYQARIRHQVYNLSHLVSEHILIAIDHQIDLLIEEELIDRALLRTRKLFNESTWNAFRLTVIEGHSGAEVSDQLGISRELVYKSKERFETAFNKELRILKDLD